MIKTNGHNKKINLSFESLVFPEFKSHMEMIHKKAGKRPEIPEGLTKGDWTEQALKVLKERYLLKDENGNLVETPDEMCFRVAWDIASAEVVWGAERKDVLKSAKEFYQMMTSREFLPNSPTLMNAGTGNGLQYSACFVLPVPDSLVGIFDAIKYQAIIHQTGGGTGFSFNRLRQRGAMVKSSRGTASGPVSFMTIFDSATNQIKQGGKRRGANMGILKVDHPDILEFIHCKEEGGITNFNISVAITDAFMKAYEEDTDYDLISPKDGSKVGSLNARKVFDEIADAAWRTGDPGLIFIDRINSGSANPVPSMGPVESTNPCGEQPLYPYDSCNLGSIFMNYFVKGSSEERTLDERVDWEKLGKTVHSAVRFLDNVIEMNPYPLEDIRKTSLAIRRIGLGVGGWADMLIELGIPYDSQEALDLAEKVMKFISDEGIKESNKLAIERGVFPMYPLSIYAKESPRRNSTVTTIAPTGTISILAGASSGIEPLFAIAYQHIVKDKHLDRTLTFFNPKFEDLSKKSGIWNDEIKEKVANHGVVRGLEEVSENIKKIFGTAHEIDYEWHIQMQSAFQKYTENAVSKTINMRNDIKVSDIKEAYLLSWRTGCKGITVFRDGCKDAQVLNAGVNSEKKEEIKEKVLAESEWERPFKINGSTYKIKTPVGTAFITLNEDSGGNLVEIFVNVGKAGSDVQAMAEALGRVTSKALKFGSYMDPKKKAQIIAEQLAGIGGRRSVGFGPTKILSLPDAMAAAISMHLGLRVNGFGPKENYTGAKNHQSGIVENDNGKSVLPTFLESKSTEIQSDLAGAVMPAQFSAQQGSDESQSDDHTAASAKSYLTSGLHPDQKNTPLGEQLFLENSKDNTAQLADICPSCGASSFVYQEGCAKCYSCSFSEC
jgi:ribonucleoside-diphosphate reductase alpha chain